MYAGKSQAGAKRRSRFQRAASGIERAAHHQAIHGGGNWRLGRTWPQEWNQMLMEALLNAESAAGRMLTRNAILKMVAMLMRNYGIPMNFVTGRGR